MINDGYFPDPPYSLANIKSCYMEFEFQLILLQEEINNHRHLMTKEESDLFDQKCNQLRHARNDIWNKLKELETISD